MIGLEGPWGAVGERGERGPKGDKGNIGLMVRAETAGIISFMCGKGDLCL